MMTLACGEKAWKLDSYSSQVNPLKPTVAIWVQL